VNIQSWYKPFLITFRKKRMVVFENIFKPLNGKNVLDVGAAAFSSNWPFLKSKPKLTVINLKLSEDDNRERLRQGIDFVVGNCLKLPFKDKSFDIVYSNSVIEHLGSLDNQKLFAKELMRVGKSIFIQTPNKYFFMEPHFITPFIHYFPKGFQKNLLRYFTIWGLVSKPSRQKIKQILGEIRLLSYGELKRIFPGCKIMKESFLFFTKSFYICKKN